MVKAVKRSMVMVRDWVSQAPKGRMVQIVGGIIAAVGVAVAFYYLSTQPRRPDPIALSPDPADFSPHFKRPVNGGMKQGIWGPEEASQLGLSKEWRAYSSAEEAARYQIPQDWNAYNSAKNKALNGYLISWGGGVCGGIVIIGAGMGVESLEQQRKWKEAQAQLEGRLVE